VAVLSGLGFDLGTRVSNFTSNNQRVFLRHTTAMSYATTQQYPDSTNASLVYSGQVTQQDNGWQQLAFNQLFNWNGVNNLEILWLNYHGTSRGRTITYRHTSTTGFTMVGRSSNTSFPTSSGFLYTSRPILQLITPMPPGAAIAVYPSDGGLFYAGSSLRWISGGRCPTSYDVYLGTQNPPPRVNQGQVNSSYEPNLAPDTTYYWKIVSVNASGNYNPGSVWSFRTSPLYRLGESFESNVFPPPGWSNPGGWQISDEYPYHGAFSSLAIANADGKLLATPRLYIRGDSRLEFHALSSQHAGTGLLRIKYSDDLINWHCLVDNIDLGDAYVWQRHTVDLGSLAWRSLYLGFEAFSVGGSAVITLDHVYGPQPSDLFPIPAASIVNESGSLLLMWIPQTEAVGYTIYASEDPLSFCETPLVECDANTVSYAIPPGTKMFFRVAAVY